MDCFEKCKMLSQIIIKYCQFIVVWIPASSPIGITYISCIDYYDSFENTNCPASQKILAFMGKKQFSLEISKFSLALQPEALVNTSRRVLFSSPEMLIKTEISTNKEVSCFKSLRFFVYTHHAIK